MGARRFEAHLPALAGCPGGKQGCIIDFTTSPEVTSSTIWPTTEGPEIMLGLLKGLYDGATASISGTTETSGVGICSTCDPVNHSMFT